jgi:hypothetical protein|tara:strand:+ start:2135 stop:2890 length:756 start_codon:yes stop_codon:yes gene_type:complete
MKKIINFFFIIVVFFLYSCAEYNIQNNTTKPQREYFSSSGFALIYDQNLFESKIINKKIDNSKIYVLHKVLKTNTKIRITNPSNSKSIETKIYKKANYPSIFNSIISKKVSSTLELDINNPYVEIVEIKKNKTFIAKKSNTFEEEKNVANKVPVDEIKVNDITNEKVSLDKKKIENKKFIIVISDFYYLNTANNLKNELLIKIKNIPISVKKITENKHRLMVGPFNNFNALKTIYISLNNLGFEDINIYKE